MSMDLLGHCHGAADSAVHRMSAGVKLFLALMVITGTVFIPGRFWPWHASVGALLVVGLVVGRVSAGFVIKRLLLLSPFVLGVALVNASQPELKSHWVSMTAKSMLCLCTVILVSNTTSFGRMLGVLQRARVPRLLITTLALMHRYLFVLVDEAERMRRARLSRTFRRDRRFRWGALGTVIGQLFVRASERAERIYDAMCARGWK